MIAADAEGDVYRGDTAIYDEVVTYDSVGVRFKRARLEVSRLHINSQELHK